MNLRSMRLIGALFILVASAAWSADRTWDGGDASDSNWTSAANWDGGHPNGTSDGATMAGNTRTTPVLDADITLNQLTFAAGAANFTISNPAKTLTMGGTAPFIEVYAGTQTISSQFAVSGDLTILVHHGASLEITDTAIAGTGTITIYTLGSGNVTFGDTTGPSAPTWLSPAVDGATTNDTTPTWTWVPGDGVGAFRFRLDGGSWIQTSAVTFTPTGALGAGSHSLDVQERDAAGNWSTSATRSVVIDAVAPTITARTTKDIDNDGHVDAVDVGFSEIMAATAGGTWTVAGYTVGTPAWQSTTVLRLPLTELSAYDTGVTPLVRYTAGTLQDAAGNLLGAEASSSPAADGAAPVIVHASAVTGSTVLSLLFSEGVATSAGGGNLVTADLAYGNTTAGGATGITSVTSGNATAGGAVFAANAAFAAGDLGSDTIAAASSAIFDLVGNAMGTTTVTIVAGPGTPTFSAPSGTTSDATPTWSWASGGGGAGTFRFKLDDSNLVSGATATTATTFTPGAALGDGSHTLYVQESDAAGTWSATGSRAVTIDATAPTITARSTRDGNGNGQIDAIRITFTESMGTTQTGSWTVSGYAVGTPTWISPTVLDLTLTEKTSSDTGATPQVRYTRPGNATDVVDAAGNALATEPTAVLASDGAGPIVLSVSASAGSNQLVITFSEAVTDEAGGNLSATDFIYSNLGAAGATALSATVDGNGLDASINLTTDVAVAAGDLNADRLAPKPANVMDQSGNAAVALSVALITPTPYFKSYVAGGDWNDPATWEQGRIPASNDDVLIVGPVTLARGSFGDCSTLTFSGAGALTCTGGAPGPGEYCLMRIYGGSNQVNAQDDTVLTDINLWDLSNFGATYPIVFTVASGATLTLNNTIQGQWARTVIKRGDGLLLWNAPACLYQSSWDDGPTIIEAGTFRLTNATGRPAGFDLQVAGGAICDLQVDFAAAQLTGQGTIRRGVTGVTSLSMTGSSWSGTITDGSGSLVVTTTGSNTWSGLNSFTGGLTLSSGSLAVSGTKAIADTCPVVVGAAAGLSVDATETVGSLSGSGTVTINAPLTVNHGSTVSVFAGSTSGAGSLTVAGAAGGSLALTQTNSHAGGTVIAAGGTLIAGGNQALGATAGRLTFDGGTLELSANVNMTAAVVATAAAGTGPSAVIPLQGAPAVDRPISVTANDGTLRMAAYSLAVSGFDTTGGQDLTVIGNGTTTLNSGDPALFVVCSGSNTWAGQLINGSAFGFLCKQGAGSLAITNGGNTWSKRAVRVEEGTLTIGASGSLGTLPDGAFVLPGAIGRLDDVAYASAPTLFLGGTLGTSGTSAWQGPVNLWLATPVIDVAAASELTLSSSVTHTSATSLGKTGGGTLVLAAANGFSLSSGLSILAGTVSIAADDRLGAASNAITLNGGTLATTATFATGRGIVLGGSGGTIDVGSGTTLTCNASSVLSGGGGALRKAGSGALVLGGTNTYGGGTTINGGELVVSSDANLGAAATSITIAGGALRSTASATLAGRAVSIGAASGAVTVSSGILQLPGVIGGVGTLTVGGPGTLALSGANTLSGPIVVSSGTLSARSAGALGTTAGGTSVADGATLDLNGSFASAEPLSLVGTGVAAAGVLVSSAGSQTLSGAVSLVQGANAVAVSVASGSTLGVSGVVSGAGGFGKTGAGTLALSGTNTFTGQVTVGQGALAVGADSRLGSAANELLLNGGSLLATASFASSTRTVRIGTSGGQIDTATFTVTLPGIDTGPSQPLTIAGSGSLIFDIASGQNRTIAGLLVSSGTAGVTKAGAGGLALTAASGSFTTTMSVAGGRVRLDGSLAGPVIVQSGAVLGGTGAMGALSVQGGGTLKPGDPQAQGPGVLTASSLTLATGAILDYDLGTANDLVSVSGTAVVDNGVQLNVLSYPASGSFADGSYAIVNAGISTTYAAGTMTASLPNSYDLTTGAKRAKIGVSGTNLVLNADSSLPAVSAITSASPDGTYYQGDSFDVTVQFTKAITPSGSVNVQVSLTNSGSPVVRSVTVSAPTYPATSLSGTYLVQTGDITAPGEVNATSVALAGSLTDGVGHAVTGSLAVGGAGSLTSMKDIIIDNFVPLLQIAGGSAGDTQPASVTMNTRESRLFDPATNDTAHVLVLAADQETTDHTQLTYRLQLEPSQGEVQLLVSGTWSVGTVKRVVASVTDASTQVASFTQADIDAGSVRYNHTALSGGNDAILMNVTDGDGKVSALYLLRFAISGNAAPVVGGLPALLTYAEEATHAVWLPITAAADVSDNDATFPDGRISISMTGAQSGDQIDLRPDATGVTVNGAQISVGSVLVGTLTRTGATSLEVRFDSPTTAGPSEAEAIINALGYRTVSQAPDPSVARAIQVSITDGNASQTPNVYVVPLQLTLYNDPPVVTVSDPIITVPGLPRTFTVTVSDPEGETALTYAIAAPPSPQAVRGALVQTTSGVFTYTPYYPEATAVGDPLQDAFAIVVTDAAFTPGSTDPLRRGTAAAVSTTSSAYSVRISDGGGDAPRFQEPMRMTVSAGLSFAYQPQVQAATGATLTWELIDPPVQLSAAFALAPPNQASFDTVSGQLSWPSVPAPADGSGYYRFGILVTDSTNQTATLLPVMLRVGPGGAG